MKKLLSFSILAVLAAGLVFAQSISDPDPELVGADSAMKALREVSVDKFEREGGWTTHISSDYGFITGRLFEGGPALKEPLPEDEGKEDLDNMVYGVKVDFFRRGKNPFTIMSNRPLPIEGVTKTVSVWVCGRNQDHELYLLVEDYFGHEYELYMGDLGFTGWKKLTCVVPPTPDGEHGIVQKSAYYGDKPGLRILGFRVDCSPMKARGTFYMYLDDLRAVTDLYDIQHHDEDDMMDNW